MTHVLDNPIYNALISGNKDLAVKGDNAHYFRKDVAPFAGLRLNIAAGFDTIRTMAPAGGTFVFFTPEEISIPESWTVIKAFKMKQMCYKGPLPTNTHKVEIIDLHKFHVPEMIELTNITAPGPFFENTIVFGNYIGVFIDGKLIAMAGQRMQPLPYVEISAVCTHPDHTGKGYAGMLLNEQIKRIMLANRKPFLHVVKDNPAVKVYERMGFKTRRSIFGYWCNI